MTLWVEAIERLEAFTVQCRARGADDLARQLKTEAA
jgi:hypothetical protein